MDQNQVRAGEINRQAASIVCELLLLVTGLL